MLEIIFLVVLALIWIIAATIQDLKNNEVANWISFSLIIFALGFRFFYSLFSNNGFGFFYQGVIGLGIFFALGNLFYYSKLFAGGDAKLMISLGTILPLSSSFTVNIWYFIFFLLIFFITGTVYGMIWSFVLIFKNFKPFKREFYKLFKKSKNLIYFFMFMGLLLIIIGFYENLLFYLGIFILIFPYFFLYAKAIDEASMVKRVSVKSLREGDWLYSDVKIGKKVVKADWGGLSQKNIKDIQKRYRFIKIRQGIAFVPVFLISFVIFIYGILLGSRIFSSLISFF